MPGRRSSLWEAMASKAALVSVFLNSSGGFNSFPAAEPHSPNRRVVATTRENSNTLCGARLSGELNMIASLLPSGS